MLPATGGVVIDPAALDTPWTAQAVDAASLAGQPDAARTADGPGRQLVVDVEGAVIRPGLVTVRPGGRVGDAVDLAGGFAANADLEAAARALNLAQEVSDGMKVVVPAIGLGIQANGDAETPPGGSEAMIDLNRATEAQLDTLPGVGPATVGRIVAARDEAPFATVEELRSRGIVGEATFDKLRDLITVDR
jgi:competence protein ComEA